MGRMTRYQAAIMHGKNILLIQQREHATGRSFWVIPGGGIEAGETETECVQREAREETHLHIKVEALLLDEPRRPGWGRSYERYKTYLCRPMAGDAAPGCEPEPDAAASYAIVDVGWYNLFDETTWGAFDSDPVMVYVLRRIRRAMEQVNAGADEQARKN
jgi:8-oxo-dGTP pyrophosphatase MutT (NUDIX family)